MPMVDEQIINVLGNKLTKGSKHHYLSPNDFDLIDHS
jgi:hypothetical protein